MSCPALAGPFSCGSPLPSFSLPWLLGWTKIHVMDEEWVFIEKVISLELFEAGTEVKKKIYVGWSQNPPSAPWGSPGLPCAPTES